jgi:16S rRNA (guanine527-N7)-methyltransferase
MPVSTWLWEFARPDFFGKHECMTPPSYLGLSDRQILDALSPYGLVPNSDSLPLIREYISLLLKWNRAVSLTTVTNPVEIVARHFGEPIFATKLLPVDNCRLVDIGTGAGFPGLSIKTFCPKLELILIESNKKKCVFLHEVVRALGFSSVEIRSERFEQIRPETIEANIITSRAVGEFKQLLRWSKNALVHRGHLMLWIGADDATRIVHAPGWIWQPAARIPESQRRFILIGRPAEDPLLTE